MLLPYNKQTDKTKKMKKIFVKPSMKALALKTENLMTGSGETKTPNMAYGGSNSLNGAPKTAESRKATHITDSGYDY